MKKAVFILLLFLFCGICYAETMDEANQNDDINEETTIIESENKKDEENLGTYKLKKPTKTSHIHPKREHEKIKNFGIKNLDVRKKEFNRTKEKEVEYLNIEYQYLDIPR